MIRSMCYAMICHIFVSNVIMMIMTWNNMMTIMIMIIIIIMIKITYITFMKYTVNISLCDLLPPNMSPNFCENFASLRGCAAKWPEPSNLPLQWLQWYSSCSCWSLLPTSSELLRWPSGDLTHHRFLWVPLVPFLSWHLSTAAELRSQVIAELQQLSFLFPSWPGRPHPDKTYLSGQHLNEFSYVFRYCIRWAHFGFCFCWQIRFGWSNPQFLIKRLAEGSVKPGGSSQGWAQILILLLWVTFGGPLALCFFLFNITKKKHLKLTQALNFNWFSPFQTSPAESLTQLGFWGRFAATKSEQFLDEDSARVVHILNSRREQSLILKWVDTTKNHRGLQKEMENPGQEKWPAQEGHKSK